MIQRVRENKERIWYSFCFLLLGIIDQRRGSAVGEIQMIFANLTGIVLAMMLVPSLKLTNFNKKIYYIWTPICSLMVLFLCISWKRFWTYQGQWNTAVLGVAIWSYLIIYIVIERKFLFQKIYSKASILVLLLCMVFSMNEKGSTLWCLLIFGGFFLIGISEPKIKTFYLGMMDGIIVWFILQQTLAFAFRPYDYVRYRGLYAGETQNGIFYVMVFCAFVAKWIWTKYESHQRKSWLYFFLIAISVDFVFLTGSRTGLLTVLVVGLIVITKYDIIENKMFYKWILHGGTMIICIIAMLPVIYGCVRYFPTILHHPIWFVGEYEEGKSVCSFDPWDSEKYISFDEALNETCGRIGNVLKESKKFISRNSDKIFGRITVYAKELTGEKGDTEENYYLPDDISPDEDPLWSRKVIYKYYFEHLNLQGHKTSGQGFYTIWRIYYGHAHDMFLQVAYDYGILCGILFLIIYLNNLIKALVSHYLKSVINGIFLLGIMGFGLWEMVLTPGQITVPLMWINLYLICTDNKNSYKMNKTI